MRGESAIVSRKVSSKRRSGKCSVVRLVWEESFPPAKCSVVWEESFPPALY